MGGVGFSFVFVVGLGGLKEDFGLGICQLQNVEQETQVSDFAA